MRTGNTKIGTRIWIPVLEKFSQRIDAACLRRDGYLAKVLESELDELDREVMTPNSDAARQFIAAHLDLLPRKLVTLTLPEILTTRLDELCASKRMVRDSFFNRLLFMLSAEPRVLYRMWFDDDDAWFPHLLGETFFKQDAAARLLDPIQTDLDPFWAYREGLATWYHDKPPAGIYTAALDDKIFPKVDLRGLNVYLPDELVPGTEDHGRLSTLLDDLLSDAPATHERQT